MKNFLMFEDDSAVEQVAQGGRVSLSGDIQKPTWTCSYFT